MQYKLTLITILLTTGLSNALIRPATIIPGAAPPLESHTIEKIFTGEQVALPEPKLVHIPPAHPSPEPIEEREVTIKSSTDSSDSLDLEPTDPKRLHSRSFIPTQKVLIAERTSPEPSAPHGQHAVRDLINEVAHDIDVLKHRLEARVFVADVVRQLNAAAIHKREVERIHKMARRARTEETFREVMEMVGAVVKREERRREEMVVNEVVHEIQEVLHLE